MNICIWWELNNTSLGRLLLGGVGWNYLNLRIMNYKLLGRSGIKVSELCLGTNTFGTSWEMGIGTDKKESRRIFDYYVDHEGNFIDTAIVYEDGQSESYLGDFMKGKRSQVVLATKYSFGLYSLNKSLISKDPSFIGNSRKSLVQSVEHSLQTLKTDYIDLLYVHFWDSTTEVEELMRSLEYLCQSGKILAIGFSNTPSWVIAEANTLACCRGWSPISTIQLKFNLLDREAEREFFKLAAKHQISIVSWGSLAYGLLTGKYFQKEKIKEPTRFEQDKLKLSEKETAIIKEVIKIAEELGCKPLHVAINWLRKINKNLIPAVGARNVSQIKETLDCLRYNLSEEQFQKLQALSTPPNQNVYPYDFIEGEGSQRSMFGKYFGKIDF
ncbi:aldo/keto reductase [Xanthovirga aplysinae]|uniref:aldo/keto reductase n=1 Tax=Xanthovirga aplysinae TaxID=2529853 RepID=UPI0012BBE0F2|nr:aldo/keto reductase [Xanthovirga aplysinae]MTI33342.1 aldo/keto reductase [Xanthovirga aplysinae]